MKTLALSILLTSSFAFAESGGGISWKAPTSWKLDVARPMRVATYAIAPAGGDKEGAELGVFFFGQGQGGSVEDNVKRWSGQFSDGKPAIAKQTKVGTLDVTRVTIEGTYAQTSGPPMAGGPVTQRPNWELAGAIVAGPQGPVFFKLIGPKKTVEATRAELDRVVKSITVDAH